MSTSTAVEEETLRNCVGLSFDDCKEYLEKANPSVEVLAVKPKAYDYFRVMIRYDPDSGKVDLTPGRG